MAIPKPEPGLVVSYAYLWHGEYQAGRQEGRKDRPSVIVIAVEREGETMVTVLPITHAVPSDPKSAVELPSRVKQHLGLDDQRSWIVVAEGNEFVWPGYDLRRRPDVDRYDYGFLPPRLFNQIVRAFVSYHGRERRRIASRD
jgi:hypothetical protein